MNKNYIILAHKNPIQLKRLIEKLNDNFSSFWIHIDKNQDIEPFIDTLNSYPNLTFVSKRENGTWGDLGIVKGTINALKEIINSKKEGYCILISGQDYPIKNKEKINCYFIKNNGYDFIDVSPIFEVFPTEWKIRLNYYKYNLSNNRGKYILFSSKFDKSFFSLNCIKNIIKIILYKRDLKFIKEIISNFNKERCIPENLTPYAGAQWWALTYQTAIKVVNFIEKNPSFYSYNEYSLLPDETFFQTIIKHLSITDSSIKIKESLTYTNWSRDNCDLPVTFNDSDIDELTGQPENKLFARKFDYNYNKEIFNLLDKI